MSVFFIAAYNVQKAELANGSNQAIDQDNGGSL